MRLAVYCSDPAQLTRLAQARALDAELRLCPDWQLFEAEAVEASCAVVVLHGLGQDNGLARLRDLRNRHQRTPLLLIVPQENTAHLSLLAMEADGTVLLQDVERNLEAGAKLAIVKRTLHEMARALIQKLPATAVKLRRALALAFESERPFTSVTALAARVNCHARTLWYHWRKLGPATSSLRLQDLIDWLLLIDAVARKSPEDSWVSIATDLHVHEQTLAQIAVRLTGVTLRNLPVGVSWLLNRFGEQLGREWTRTAPLSDF